LIVAFDDNGEICVASDEVSGDIDIDLVLHELTGKHLSEHLTQPTALFELTAEQSV
jgi:hypothetical protein